MITLQELKTNITKQKYFAEADEWFPVDNDHNFEVGDLVRTPDGLVRVMATHKLSKSFYGTIITPIHDDVRKGETYEYRNYETQVLAKVKDKRLVRKDLARSNNNKVKQLSKDDELLQISDEEGRHKSPDIYNPININPVIEMCEGVLSNKEIKDLTKGYSIKEGLSDSMARGIALVVKRKAMTLGKQAQQEKDIEKKLVLISRQISATAALALLAISVGGDGLLSKAGVVSGLFSG